MGLHPHNLITSQRSYILTLHRGGQVSVPEFGGDMESIAELMTSGLKSCRLAQCICSGNEKGGLGQQLLGQQSP